MTPTIVAAHRSLGHSFSKLEVDEIRLVAGLGVEDDAHSGAQVKHRSRVKRDPTQPNLRQVHLLHSELFADVARNGFAVEPGDLGENVTTQGLDLLGLGHGAVLRLGRTALVGVTGLRNPCDQINAFQGDLLGEVLERDGELVVRKAGIMGVVLLGGVVRPGDRIEVSLAPGPHRNLGPV